MTRDDADRMFDAQMRNLRYAATIAEGRDRPDRADIAESCRWAESRLTHYRERDAALSSAPPDLVRDVAVFVGRCRDIRHGSPNAFYAHVDKFCKAWPTCPDCGGMGTTTHDILVGGTEHDTEERDCQTCATTGIAPPVSPVVAPAPVVEEAPYCERHGTMCANDEMGRLWSCDCQTAEPCPCGNGYVYTPNHVSPRETPDRRWAMTLATLRRIEWAGLNNYGDPFCPVCRRPQWDKKHAPDCELAAALREAEKGEPMPDLQIGDEVDMAQTVTFRREDAAAGWRPARPLSVKRNGVVIWRKEAPTL